jgi:broad specificity phosphatase PhoE
LLPLTALKNQLEASPTQNTSISYTNLTHPILSTNSPVPKPKSLLPPKRVLIIRHGQAQHNPRAEASREAGCSFDEFLKLMELDDTYDAELTSLGKKQAHATRDSFSLSDIKMVISSPLSRALQTADLIHPPSPSTRRVAIEHFREINGKLLNAQRRPRSDLEKRFPHWCFHEIPELDESWTDELETHEDCSERGYRGLLWVLKQPEESVLLVGHGGLLNHMMNGHENVVLVDGRQPNVDSESESRCITKRFGNCELREFIITAWDNSANQRDPVITLEEITLSMKA